MPALVLLLRAVKDGGTGNLPMTELRRLCEEAGFRKVRTYIASGNVAAERNGSEAEAKAALEAELRPMLASRPRDRADGCRDVRGRRLEPLPRSGGEPHRRHLPRCGAPADALSRVTGQANEEIRLGAREIYVHYPDGIGRSKLRIPAARDGTARNMNTVAKLAAMAAG